MICLILQTLGIVALNPESHEVLTQADVPDTVLHLILPADEMFYTNQTTKFARYVKHLGARILVYMGLLTKVNHKVNLFDILGRFAFVVDARWDFLRHCRSRTRTVGLRQTSIVRE